MKVKITLLSLLICGNLFSQTLFDNSLDLKTISTKYFTIIFPASSSNTVKRLLSFADSEYERLGKLFKVKHYEKIKIVLTPDIELINGMFSSHPYNIIVLYDYLDDATLLPFNDYLYNLFLHELTHAVSLNLRNDFWYLLRTLFGNYISPHNWQVPYWMIEGVTVSIESADGDGRSNDPRSKALLAQHLLENKFQTLSQISSIRPYPKKGELHYIYGGLFNTYLQKKYGWEKYANLWYRNNILLLPYTFDRSFEAVYEIDLYTTWENFSKEFYIPHEKIKNPVVKIIDKGIIDSFDADEKNLYYSESKRKEIRLIDLKNNKKKKLIDQSGNFSINKAKELLYLESISVLYKTYKKDIKIFDIKNKRFLKKKYSKLSKLSSDKSGEKIVCIEPVLHRTDLVIISNGVKETIFKGNEYVFFDQPIFLDDDSIAFILISTNKRSIGILKGKILDIYETENVWIDEINSFEDGLVFNYYFKDKISLSRIGFFYTSKEEVYLQDEDYYGGIHNPVIIGENLYFLKRLTDYDELVMVENYKTQLKLISTNFTKKTYTTDLFNESFSSMEEITAETLKDIKNYNPLPYLLPPFWMPFAYPFPLSTNNWITGMGFYTGSTDPVMENSYEFLFHSLGDPFRNDSLKNFLFNFVNESLPLRISFKTGMESYLDTNVVLLGASLGKNFMLKSGKSYLPISVGIESRVKIEKWENKLYLDIYYYYNQLIKMPVYSFTFISGVNFEYLIEENMFGFNGKLIYNNGWFISQIGGGIANKNIYGIGKNIEFWGILTTFYDENKLKDKYLTFDESILLRFNIDRGPWIKPIFFNYIAAAIGYRNLLTEIEYQQAIYGRIYLGTILFYNIPLNPYFELFYLVEKDTFGYNLNATLNF